MSEPDLTAAPACVHMIYPALEPRDLPRNRTPAAHGALGDAAKLRPGPTPMGRITMTGFNERLHDAAALIPDRPPLEQSVFKLVTCELPGRGIPGAEAQPSGEPCRGRPVGHGSSCSGSMGTARMTRDPGPTRGPGRQTGRSPPPGVTRRASRRCPRRRRMPREGLARRGPAHVAPPRRRPRTTDRA
jgi:hypothetical protein